MAENKALPYCAFPSAADGALHGLQPLPDELPVFAPEDLRQYRSSKFKIVPVDMLSTAKLLQLVRVIGDSFSVNEPILRHLALSAECPTDLMHATLKDPFGEGKWGEWTMRDIMYWYIRLFVLTDPFSPADAIAVNDKVLKQSLAVLDDNGEPIGGALNISIDLANTGRAMRDNDPFITAVLSLFEPIAKFLAAQINLSVNAVCKKYPAYLAALKAGKVADFYMVARSPLLPKDDTFELAAASAERFLELGFEYMIVSASNQWTGAASEALGAVRVHFKPFRNVERVYKSAVAVPGKTSSIDGFLSDKDSGCMQYVLRLK